MTYSDYLEPMTEWPDERNGVMPDDWEDNLIGGMIMLDSDEQVTFDRLTSKAQEAYLRHADRDIYWQDWLEGEDAKEYDRLYWKQQGV